MRVLLARDWDYPPSPKNDTGHFVGRHDEVERLANDILRKDSGAVLVSGARGVGKTSLGYRALQIVREKSKSSGERPPLVVLLNASQLQNSLEDNIDRAVITGLIRRLYAAVHEHSDQSTESNALGDDLRDLYRKAVSSRVEISTERSRASDDSTQTADLASTTIQIAPSLKTLLMGAIGFLAGGLGLYFWQTQPWASLVSVAVMIAGMVAVTMTKTTTWKKTSTTTKALEARELYVKDNDIGNLESDLESVLAVLSKDFKVVFVVDELDKLIAPDKSIPEPTYVLSVIRGFKNLFTLSPAIFLFITGDEVYGHVEQSRQARSVDGTLFTYRFFLKRPEWCDLEQFIREVAEHVEPQDGEFEDFIDYICYEARSDFTYLYDMLRDHVTEFDDELRPVIETPAQSIDESNRARAQKSLGLVYDQYKYSRPSGWQKNERLLTFLYEATEAFIGKAAGVRVQEPPPDDPDAAAVVDLYALIERHGGLQFIGNEPLDPADPDVTVDQYQWTGRVEPIPSSLGKRTTLEAKTFSAWSAISNLAAEYTRIHNAVQSGRTPKGAWLDKNRFVTMAETFGLDLRARVKEHRAVITALQKKPPIHQTREQLEETIEAFAEMRSEALGIAHQVAAESASSDVTTSYTLAENPTALDAYPDVASAVASAGVPCRIVVRDDNPTQMAVFMLDAPQSFLDAVATILKTSNKTLRLINVGATTDSGSLPKNATKRGLYTISLQKTGQFILVLRGTKKWLAQQ